MLPGQTPPILMITGEACDEAVSQIRTIVDPASHTMIDLPINQKDLAQQAIENRVLAYTNYDELTQTKIDAFKAMYRGLTARLKQASRKFDRLYTILTRPILIASQIKQQISNHQITIEINKWREVAHSEILGPLLDVVVQIIGQPITYPEPQVMAMPRIANQYPTPQWVNTSRTQWASSPQVWSRKATESCKLFETRILKKPKKIENGEIWRERSGTGVSFPDLRKLHFLIGKSLKQMAIMQEIWR